MLQQQQQNNNKIAVQDGRQYALRMLQCVNLNGGGIIICLKSCQIKLNTWYGIEHLENKYSLLERKIDDNGSYRKRQNLRIVDIPEEAHESGASCLTKVKEELSKPVV